MWDDEFIWHYRQGNSRGKLIRSVFAAIAHEPGAACPSGSGSECSISGKLHEKWKILSRVTQSNRRLSILYGEKGPNVAVNSPTRSPVDGDSQT